MNVPIKTLVISIVVLLGIMTAKHFFDKSRYKDLIKEITTSLQSEKELALKRSDSITKVRDKRINDLIDENEKTKSESAYWLKQARRKSVNPNYDIDFLTAAGIIAGSRYRPDQTNGNAGQGENDRRSKDDKE